MGERPLADGRWDFWQYVPCERRLMARPGIIAGITVLLGATLLAQRGPLLGFITLEGAAEKMFD